MRGLKWAVPLAVAGTVAAGAVAVGTLQAQTPPAPIAVEVLTQRAVFTDDVEPADPQQAGRPCDDVSNPYDPSWTVVAKITVQPGAQFPWHTHPGRVIVNVAQGELTYIMAHDCVDRPYAAGTAFVDPGRGMVHTAVNRTNGVTVLYATFFEVPETGPLTIPVDAPAIARRRCSCEVPPSGGASALKERRRGVADVLPARERVAADDQRPTPGTAGRSSSGQPKGGGRSASTSTCRRRQAIGTLTSPVGAHRTNWPGILE